MPYLGAKPTDVFADRDLNGQEFILDADADTSITADTDDQIDIRISGADDFQFTANTFTAQSGSTIAAQALTATTVGAGNGSAGSPSLTFSNDTDCGLYRVNANQLGLTVAGTAAVRWESSCQRMETDGSAGAPVYGFINDADTGMFLAGTGILGWSSAGTEEMRLSSQHLFLSDTANAGAAGAAMTINQAHNDDEIFALKSSDVAHGLTNYTETDTYAAFRKHSATLGGLLIYAMSEASNDRAIQISGFASGTNTTKSTSAAGVIDIRASKTSGTGGAVLSSNSNAVVFYASGDAKFLIDQEGDYHFDGADGGAFDDHHDSELVSTFNSILGTNSDKPDWNRMKRMSDLKLLGSVTPEEWDEGVRPLVNGSQMQRLLVGTAAQSWVREQVRDTILANLIPGYKEAVAALADGKNVGAMPEVLQG